MQRSFFLFSFFNIFLLLTLTELSRGFMTSLQVVCQFRLLCISSFPFYKDEKTFSALLGFGFAMNALLSLIQILGQFPISYEYSTSTFISSLCILSVEVFTKNCCLQWLCKHRKTPPTAKSCRICFQAPQLDINMIP